MFPFSNYWKHFLRSDSWESVSRMPSKGTLDSLDIADPLPNFGIGGDMVAAHSFLGWHKRSRCRFGHSFWPSQVVVGVAWKDWSEKLVSCIDCFKKMEELLSVVQAMERCNRFDRSGRESLLMPVFDEFIVAFRRCVGLSVSIA